MTPQENSKPKLSLPIIETCDKCGRCCTAISIKSLNKSAGQRCIHLGPDNLCKIWNQPQQPEVCRTIKPTNDLCRFDLRGLPNEAKLHFHYLRWLDRITTPK